MRIVIRSFSFEEPVRHVRAKLGILETLRSVLAGDLGVSGRPLTLPDRSGTYRVVPDWCTGSFLLVEA